MIQPRLRLIHHQWDGGIPVFRRMKEYRYQEKRELTSHCSDNLWSERRRLKNVQLITLQMERKSQKTHSGWVFDITPVNLALVRLFFVFLTANNNINSVWWLTSAGEGELVSLDFFPGCDLGPDQVGHQPVHQIPVVHLGRYLGHHGQSHEEQVPDKESFHNRLIRVLIKRISNLIVRYSKELLSRLFLYIQTGRQLNRNSYCCTYQAL